MYLNVGNVHERSQVNVIERELSGKCHERSKKIDVNLVYSILKNYSK